MVVPALFDERVLAPAREAFGRLHATAQRLRATQDHAGARFVLADRGGDVVVQRVVWAGGAEPALLDIGADPRLVGSALQLLGSDRCEQLLCQAHFKMPGDGVSFDWHQDVQHRDKGPGTWRDVNGRGSYVQTLLAIDEMRADNGPLQFLPRDAVRLETSPAAPPLQARLVVAADGANSLVRSAAGLPAEIEDYQQVAVVAHVTAARAAAGIAYERFTPDGPFAVLPLHDGNYGVVWTLTPQAAEQVMALPDAQYLTALQQAFGWRIGRFERVGQRSAYPLKLTRASAVTGPRVALIGNAAQALHPVAGQGFNLGLRDAATLAEVLAERLRGEPDLDVGSDAVLAEFATRRASDRDGVTRLTDGLVKVFGDSRPGVPLLRDLGLLLFDLSPTAKQAMSRLSWGFAGKIPRLARGLPLLGAKRA